MRKYFKIQSNDSIWFKFGALAVKRKKIFFITFLTLLSVVILLFDAAYKPSFKSKIIAFFYQNNLLYNFSSAIRWPSSQNHDMVQLQALKTELQIYKAENLHLKKMLNFIQNEISAKQKIFTTQIILNQSDNELIIRLGAKNGIKKRSTCYKSKRSFGQNF